jgi:hypothetical protein
VISTVIYLGSLLDINRVTIKVKTNTTNIIGDRVNIAYTKRRIPIIPKRTYQVGVF